MDRQGNPTKILLGMGVFAIDGVQVGICRGGGQFTVEREYRKMQADGDKGSVKGRIIQEGSIPKLKMSVLEIIHDNLPKLYPGLEITSGSTAGSNTYTVTTNFVADDVVTFAGETFTADTDFTVGTDVIASASNLATALGANATVSALYTVTSAGAVITITETSAGGGNTPGTMVVTGTGEITIGAATTSLASGSTKITGKGVIDDDDYNATVTWAGKTRAGKEVLITLDNAINLDNIDLTLVEKDDAVATLTYEGTYLESSPDDYEPWSIVYVN